MISQKRLLLTTVLASLVNSILMLTVFRDGNAILDGRVFEAGFWNYSPAFPLIPLVQLFSWGFSTAGLFLLLLVMRPVVPCFIKGWAAKSLFVLGGVGIGSAIFSVMLGELSVGGFFGAVTASLFVAVCPEWFDEWRT